MVRVKAKGSTAICGIYYFKNRLNGKMYIGQSIDCEGRISEHLYKSTYDFYKNSYKGFYSDLNTYRFDHGIICECEIDQLNELEDYYIAQFKSDVHGYNTMNKNKVTNHYISDEHKRNISNAMKGHVVSEATKKRMSESAKLRGSNR